ncbi:MAG: hypothetical protein JNK82_15705, partial [Myxococcaceae bacterium]|nr:hypothetical protein [Myxococcaceae bacterium]
MKCFSNACALALAVAASGCITTGNMQRAETLGRGNFEFGVEPGLWAGIITNRNANAGNVYLPSLNFSARFGVSDRVDIGGRFGSGILELQTKFMLTAPESSFVLSLAPTVQGFAFGGSAGAGFVGVGFANIAVPLLIGFKFGPHELTLGPRVNNFLLFGGSGVGGSAVAYAFLPGLSVGFAARVTDFFELMPEVSVALPVASAGGVSGNLSAGTGGNGVLLNVGVGVKFGRLKKTGAPPPPVEQVEPPQVPLDSPPPPPPP